MAGKNLLVNGKNNITARANAMADIQADMANRTTASNVNTTPNLPTPTRPTTLNLQRAQTSINTKLNNLNNATLPTQNITPTNVGAGSVTQIQQPTQSRFIGFQKPTGQQFQPRKEPLIVHSDERVATDYNVQQAEEYKKNENLIKRFHYAVKNANGQLTKEQIKKQFPEWKNNLNAALQLQADIAPLAINGQFADMNQISEYYSDLLKKPELKDIEQTKKQSEAKNKELQNLKNHAQEILTTRPDMLSMEGAKYMQDLVTLLGVIDSYKENYNIIGGANDYEILSRAMEQNPQLEQIYNNLNERHLSDADKALFGKSDAGVLSAFLTDIQGGLRNMAGQAQNFAAEQNQLNNGENNVFTTTFNSAANILGATDKTLTAGTRIGLGQNYSYDVSDYAQSQQNMQHDLLQLGGGAAQTVWALATAGFDYARLTPLNPLVENVADPAFKWVGDTVHELHSGEKAKDRFGADETLLSGWYNNLTKEEQEDFDSVLMYLGFEAGKGAKRDLKIRADAYKDIFSDAFKRTIKDPSRGEWWNDLKQKGIVDGNGKINPDARKSAFDLIKKNFSKKFKENLKNNLGKKDQVVDFYKDKAGVKGLGKELSEIKEGVKNAGESAKDLLTKGKNKIAEGIDKGFDKMDEGIENGIENIKNKVTSKRPTSQKSEMQEQQQGLKELSSKQEQAGQNNGELKITNDTQKIEKSKTGGTLSEKVYDKLTGLDEATRERMKANPYSAEENKNLIDTMESDTAFDFNEYQTNRYQNVLDTIVDKLEQKENTRKNEVGPLYQKLEETNAPIDTTNIKNQSTKFRDKMADNDGIISSSEQTKINKLLDAIDSLGDGTTDIWKIRRMADQWAKWDTESTTDGIRLIRDIRDAIDDEIRVQRPEMKEVDTEYRRIKDEIADLRGNLINKKSGKLRDNAVSTVKNLLNPTNKQFLDRLEKEIPGITKQLQAIRDSKFVYNAYQTGNGSRFISGIARGTLGNMFKAVGVVTGGIPGLLFGALLDKAVDTALVSLTRKALKATITEMTPKAQAELESIMKKVQEGKELTAKEKAKLKEIENKIVENAENAKKTKAEQEAWDNFLDRVKKDAKSLKLPNKGGTDGGKNILTNGKTIITDARGNSKVKGQISEIDKRVKKSDSSSSDDTTPPTGGTPTNNQGGTAATDDTKTKKQPKKKAETKTKATSKKSAVTDYINETPQNDRGQLEEIEAEENLRNNETPQDTVDQIINEEQYLIDTKKYNPRNKNVAERKIKHETPKEKDIWTDSNGEEVTFYHGTPQGGFEEFSMDFRGKSNDRVGNGDYGRGMYFTPYKETAEGYAKSSKAESTNPEIYETKLRIENPLRLDLYKEFQRAMNKLAKEDTARGFSLLSKEHSENIDRLMKEFGLTEELYDKYEDIISSLGDNRFDVDIRSSGFDGIISEDGKEVIVPDTDQIIIQRHYSINETAQKPKNKVTAKKTKATNAAKAKSKGLFNEKEIDKGKQPEGLNPDALPLSDYREMQRLTDGKFYSLGDSLKRGKLNTYMATKITTDLVGNYDEIIADEFDPENLEDEWVEKYNEVIDMYDAYEKGEIEEANGYADELVKGKTAKELIDQYTPEYESDLKIYNRLSKKYPGFANGKIDLTGAEGKARRELANQENETAQDIDYQTLAEMENQTPQDIDYQDLAEMENETPQMLEEESTNKVTSNSRNKVTNGGTNLDKAIEIIKNADATKPQQGYIGEDTYARASSSDVVIKTKGDSDFNQVSFYRKAVSLSEMAQNDTMFIVLNDVGEKGIENVNKVLEGFDLQYRVGSELDNRGDTVYYLENTNTGHKDYFSDEGRSEPALSKTLRDKTVVPRLTPEQQAEYDKQMEQRRKQQEAERERERQEEEKRKEEEAKRLEEENTRKANLLTYVNDTYGDNPLQRGRVIKELSELNEESDHKIRYYGDEVPDNAEVWQVLDALADLNGSFSETRESGDNYTWTYNYGDNKSINRLTKAQKNYLEYRMNIKPVQNRIQNYLDNIENKSLRTRTENVLNKKDRWKLDDGKIVTWTKAQYIEWLVNDLGYRPKEFPTGKTYANGEPKIDYMIVNEKNAGYISSKIENGYAKSLLEAPEEELSAEDEAKLDKELFNKKSDNSDYESRIIKDNSNYKFEDLKDADIETILSKDGFEKYTFEEDGQKGEGYAGYINGKAVDIIPNKEKNRITINVGDELFRSYDDGSINVQLNGSDEITQTSSVYDNEAFKGTLARALGTEYKALGEPKSYKYDKDNGVFAVYDKSDSDKIVYEVSLGDKVMFDDGTIYDTSKHLGAGRTQGGEKHFDNKPVTEIFAGKTLIGISKGNKYASNKYTDTRAQGAVLKDMESIQELEWLLEDKNNILVGEIEGTPVKVSALDLNYNPIKMENVGKEDDYYNKVKTYKLQVGKNTDNTYFYDTFPELKSALKRIYVGEDVNKTTTEVTGEKNAVTAKQVENEKPKNLVTSRIEDTKQEIQEIDRDTYFDDIVKNLKDHPREMFIYKDGSYFYPHYILPSGKVITPENTYWGEVSSEEAARNWLLKEAEEHSEENETKKAEKLKEIVGKTAEKYEATLKRIESDNPMQEIWASGDYFKYGTSNSQMAKAKKESEANAEVGTFKKDVIDGKEGYRIFVAGTKNEAIRAFYEPKTGKTYRIYRGPVIDDSKPYTTKQVERIEKFLQNVEKQLDKETKREKVEEKDVITQEWLDSLKPDENGVVELDPKGGERYALAHGKGTLVKEGKADGKYLYNYATESRPQYRTIYIKDGKVYDSMKGINGESMTTKQDAIDWLNEKEKDVAHEGTPRYEKTEYETLPKTVSVESEAEKAGPKRIAPDRVKWQQETYDKGLENVKDVIKAKRVVFSDLGFKSLRGKAVKDIWEEKQRIEKLPESEADAQWTELARGIYEGLVIKDISKGYRYPEDVTSKFPKAQMQKAIDARARYEKGLFTSFSAKDTRANNQYRDEIGAGIKSQDGKPVTQEQMNEIVDGIRAYSNIFGVDMKKFAEDNNVIYVHLHGGNPFLMGGMSIAGLYRRDAAGNISVSLGGREGVMEKGEDGKMKKSDIKTTTVHEITHAVDGMLEGKLFSDADTEILKKTMNKPSELINYYNRKQEIVARAVEQYAAHQLGKKLYRTALANIDWENGSVEFVEKEANYVDREAYWNQENFDKYVKPIVEKNMKEKMKDYMLENTRKNVLANDKNKITSR